VESKLLSLQIISLSIHRNIILFLLVEQFGTEALYSAFIISLQSLECVDTLCAKEQIRSISNDKSQVSKLNTNQDFDFEIQSRLTHMVLTYFAVIDCPKSIKLPSLGSDCDFCKYRNAVRQVVKKLENKFRQDLFDEKLTSRKNFVFFRKGLPY
jgi:hypothetical protein